MTDPTDLVPDLVAIEGGYRVKETETHYMDVLQMFYNCRLVMTPKSCPMVYDRGWCYASFEAAVLAAVIWDGSPDTEPQGWIKDPLTGRYRPDGDAGREYVQ